MAHSIILGDPHIGASTSIGKSGIGLSLNSRITDQVNLLEWVLDQADEHNANQIIITGDVFEDPNPHANLISLFINWLTKCQAHNIEVHIIVGNHDLLRTGNFYYSPLDIITEAGLEGVYVYKNINTIYLDNYAYTLVPFRDRKSFSAGTNGEALEIMQSLLEYEVAGIPVTYKKILVGHMAIEGSMPVGNEIDDIANELLCPLSMFNAYDYVWMGHIHKPQVMQQKPYVAHVGSMDISNFGETDQNKHIIIIDHDSNSFIEKQIPNRRLKKINIVVPSGIEDTTQYVMDQIKELSGDLNKSIIKVDVALSAPELKSIDKKAVSKFLSDQGVHNISNFSETKKMKVIRKDQEIDNSFDISSAIIKFANSNIEESMRDSFMKVAMNIYRKHKELAK